MAQHRHDLTGLGQVVAFDRGVQQLHLQVQVVQALGNAVVQALRHQVALFHHRQLARGRGQAQVFQRGAKVLAQCFQHLAV
ncbi:hypothetical protein D3C72_1766330 [compost metagenome]